MFIYRLEQPAAPLNLAVYLLDREMTLHKLIYLRSDYVSVGKNSDMLTSINRQKLNIWHTSLVHFSMDFKFHQLVLSSMDNQNRHVQVF